MAKEKIILGVDPGTTRMGYGVIRIKGKQLELLSLGVIMLHKLPDHPTKLKRILERLSQLIEEHLPDEMAVEAPFFGKNVQSMLKLGRAQGVAMAAALQRGIPVEEYSPRKIKQSITGNGNSSKEQVASVLESTLNCKLDVKYDDATDGLAVAICHHYQGALKVPTTTKSKKAVKGSSWDKFLKENPERISGSGKKRT